MLPALIVRPAGFSFERLTSLRFDASSAAAREVEVARAERAQLGATYDHAVAAQRYQDHAALDNPATRKQLSKHVKRARAFARGELAGSSEPPADAFAAIAQAFPAVEAAGAALLSAHAKSQAAAAAFAEVFDRELATKRSVLREIYRADARLQEAVFLGSAQAFQRIDQLLASSGARDQRARQREQLAMRYLQRFCAKNDTNSICGPHAVARVQSGTGPSSVVVAADGEIRRTYFSHWAAEALLTAGVARAHASDVVPITLNPNTYAADGDLWWCVFDRPSASQYKRTYRRTRMPDVVALVVRLLKQPRTLTELARLVKEEHGLAGEDVAEVVDELARVGIVFARPAVPAGVFYPLDTVNAAAATWPDRDACEWLAERARWFAGQLDAFGTATMPKRVEIYDRMVSTFREVTGADSERGQGRHYADRSILHEDCYASARVEIGRDVAEPLMAAIAPLVHAASLPLELGRENVRAWFRARWGEGVRVRALEVHRAFDAEGAAALPADTPRARAIRAAIERVRGCFVAAARAGDEIVDVAAAELWRAIGDATAPDRAGYVSVDCMIRNRKDAAHELVIGEVHGFFWLPTCLLDIAPEQTRAQVLADMRAAVRELTSGRRTLETLFEHTQATDRRFPITDADLWVIGSGDREGVAFGALEVMLEGDELRFYDGEREVVPLTIYTTYPFFNHTSALAPLIDDIAGRFFPEALLAPRAADGTAPRMRCEGVVFRRRSWRRSAADLQQRLGTVSGKGRDAALVLGARALRANLGCPRQVFASFASEPKPMFVDFDNFFLLETFGQHLGRESADSSVTLSEMLPAGDELLAEGPDGPRTCELRMGFYRLAQDTRGVRG